MNLSGGTTTISSYFLSGKMQVTLADSLLIVPRIEQVWIPPFLFSGVRSFIRYYWLIARLVDNTTRFAGHNF